MTWIYGAPTWLFMTLSVVVSAAIASGLLALVRGRFIRNEMLTHNDVAGPILATIGTILAVMMSFMVVGVWQEYDQAAATTQTEASAASDLHHTADAFPPALRARLQRAVERYIRLVVNEEFPAMQHGQESLPAHDAGYDVLRMLVNYAPHDPAQQLLQSRALEYTSTMLDARRNRIMSNRQGIPIILWATMLFLGIVTVGFSFYFRVEHASAQYVMVLALTTVIALTFSLIAELDYPFRGQISVDSFAFEHVMRTLHASIH